MRQQSDGRRGSQRSFPQDPDPHAKRPCSSASKHHTRAHPESCRASGSLRLTPSLLTPSLLTHPFLNELMLHPPTTSKFLVSLSVSTCSVSPAKCVGACGAISSVLFDVDQRSSSQPNLEDTQPLLCAVRFRGRLRADAGRRSWACRGLPR